MLLFSDNTTSNSALRTENIASLLAAGFKRGGLQCRSGELQLVEKTTKTQLVFGERANVGGKGGNKYFSLSRDFASAQEAREFYYTLNLKQK